MKSARPAKISYRKLISRKTRIDLIPGNIRVGETIVPIGDEEAFIILPEVENTSTYKILKTENLEANLKIACGGNGTFKSLTLRNTGGTLSLEPGVADARLITLNPSLSEASKVDFLSEGNNWYSWGWLVGESLSATETSVYVPPFKNKTDTDGDGLSNSQEAALGTDSGNSDSDGDNVGDGIEVGTGTDPTDSSSSSDPNQDSDGDGVSDFDEILAGTNHLDPTSFPGANISNEPDPSTIGPTFTGIPNNLVVEAGTLEADAKVQALIGVVANDPQDGNIPISITFSGYDGTHGNTFTATYAATDTDGNTTTVDKTFTVEDTVAPVITLLGDNPLTLTAGTVEGSDPGATTDDGSLVISDFATVIDNTTVAGTYSVTYNSTDAAGNAATPVTRTVEVAEVSSFIEDILGVGPIYTDSESSKAGGLQVNLDTDGIIAYENGEPVNDEFTISFWANLNPPGLSNVGFIGTSIDGGRKLKIDLGTASTLNSVGFTSYLRSSTVFNGSNVNPGINIANTWTHFAFVAKSDGSNLIFRHYVNGNELARAATFSLGTKLLPPSSNPVFGFGCLGFQNNSVTGQFDSIQIGDGIALANYQIAAIAAQTDRQMTVDDASVLVAPQPSSNDTVPDGTLIGAALVGSSLEGAAPQEGLSYINEVLTVDETFTSFDSDTSYLHNNAFSFHVWFKYTGDGAYNDETMFSFNQHLGSSTSPPSHRSYWVQIPILNGGSIARVKWTGNNNTPSKTIDLDLGTSLNDGNWHLLSLAVSYTSQTETSVQAWLDDGTITGTGDLENDGNGRAGSENIWGSKTKGLVLCGRYEGSTLQGSRFSGQLTQATVSNSVITLTDVQNVYANPPS